MKGGRMRGFMCQPTASTAVCVPDAHSVVVPRRPNRTLVDHAIPGQYSRLLQRPDLSPSRKPPPPSYPYLSLPPSLPASKTEKLFKLLLPAAEAGEKKPIVLALPVPEKEKDKEKEKRADVAPFLVPDEERVIQVVVLRVSLHCQGCAGKVKKHISKMEGVTSFSVDLEAKRVTVIGHVSAEKVLESVSKVKKAELWPIQPIKKVTS